MFGRLAAHQVEAVAGVVPGVVGSEIVRRQVQQQRLPVLRTVQDDKKTREKPKKSTIFQYKKKLVKMFLKKTHLKTKRGVLPVAHVVAERFVVAQTLFFGHDACKIKRRR